jgi:CubicO group peptidase (beta-lactamase class C family)
MILSHQAGIKSYDRNQPDVDPLYSCIANSSTTLSDCVRDNLLNDNVLEATPGTDTKYSNDPWYILAELMIRKTGYENIQQLMDEYLNVPLGMNVTYDCPLVGSTVTKPHVSWGICATGHDVPKLIQQLAQVQSSIGIKKEPTNAMSLELGIISPSSVKEILGFQGGIAANADEPLAFNMPMSNCMSRSGDSEINFLIGYGLGTMITPGIKGMLFVHASTVGGYWVIAPGKYSAYFAFMKSGAFPGAYTWIARVIDRFERASVFRVRNTWDVDADSGNATYPNEITPCVDGMFVDTTILDDGVVPWANCPVPVTPFD